MAAMGVRAMFDRYRSKALTGLRVQGRINRLKELNAALRQTEQPEAQQPSVEPIPMALTGAVE